MTTIARPNGVTTHYSYDPQRYFVDEIEHLDSTSTLGRYQYDYDAVGNRIAMDITAQDGSVTQIDYAYDDAYRLTSESYLLAGGATSTTSYQYDRAGNRTQMSNSSGTTTYSYNKDDELVRVDLPDFYFEDYIYDALGNLVKTSYWREGVVPVQQGSPTLFEYSPRNLLTRVELPSTQRIDYNYDHLGNRVEQSVVGAQNPTHYLWDEFSRYGDVVLETGVNFTTSDFYHKMDYVLAGGMLVSQTNFSGNVQYFLSDAQGTTRSITDDMGVVTSEYQYDAFGNLDETIDPISIESTYLYTGQQFDPYTELYNLRARTYDPSNGRFLSRDTWAYNYQNPVELNRYGYSQNNPATYRDPSGYTSLTETTIINAINVKRAATMGGAYAGFASSTFFYIAAFLGACGDDLTQWARNTNGALFVASSTLSGAFSGYSLATLSMASPTATGLIMAAGLQQSVGKWFGEGGGCYFGAALVGLAAGNYGYNKGMSAGGANTSTNPQEPAWDIVLNPNGSYSYNNGIVANNGGTSIVPLNQGGSNSIVIPGVIGSTTTLSVANGLVPCQNSFSADTTVETPDGDVPISEIEIGDTVIGYDEDTGASGEYTVTDTISHEDDQITYVTINGEEIETTPWHLFYISDGWVEAGELETGDSVVSLNGVDGSVDSVIIVDATQTMYDLTVEVVHTFAVGEGDWVVHNCDDIPIPFQGNPEIWEEFKNDMVGLANNFNLPSGTLLVQGSSVPQSSGTFRPVGSDAAISHHKGASDIDVLLVLENTQFDAFGQARIDAATAGGNQNWISEISGMANTRTGFRNNRFTSGQLGRYNNQTMSNYLRQLVANKYSGYVNDIDFTLVRANHPFHQSAISDGYIEISR